MQNFKPLDLAKSYIANGWPVFPCREGSEETVDPTSGEIITLNEKTPRTSNGFNGASKTERILERWWSDNPSSAVGIPTGEKTGVFVLDIDAKPGGANGFEWLEEMENENGELPVTARVTTPNNGLHIYFKYVPGTRNRGALGGGVDVRSEGGYVLAAGSVMADGRSYKWTPESATIPDIADAPEWLLELLLPKPHTTTSAPYQPHAIGNTAYVNRAIELELADLADAPQGTRNNRLNDAAFALGQFVGAGVIAHSEAERELQAIAQPWGNFPKSCGTIRNGLTAGAKQPRVIPEPTHFEDNTRLVDISRMIENGIAKARAKELAASEDVVSDPPAHEPVSDNIFVDMDAPAKVEPEPANDNSPIVATPFSWVDPKDLKRREFVYGKHYIRKFVSVTSSPGGLGKTSLSIAETLAMVTGKPLLDVKVEKPLRVWLFNAEDPRDEMERRIMGACIHYKLTPADLSDRLFLDTGREQELVVAVDRKKGVEIVEPVVEAVVREIKRYGIDVMCIDPFVSTHNVNENDNGAIDKVAKLWNKIADECNIAIDLVHHIKKTGDREATVEDSRGAVSLLAAARSARVLNRMSEDQATAVGMQPKDRFGYFHVDYGKSSMTAMSSDTEWRRLESVNLGNGSYSKQGLPIKASDYAGVVVNWRWPNKAETIEQVTPEQREMIAVRIRNVECKMHIAAKDWVGYEIAYVMGWDANDKSTKARLRRMIEAWQESGFITVDRRRCPIKREMKDFAAVA